MFDRVYTNWIPDITDMHPAGMTEYMSDEEYENMVAHRDYIKANAEKIDKAIADGNMVSYAEDCVGCKDYEPVGPTRDDGWGYDDVEHGICHNMDCKDCPYRKGRE